MNTKIIIRICIVIEKDDIMKILITGANGQLGFDVIKQLKSNEIEYLGTDRESLDITNQQEVKKSIVEYCPDVVIHCAAYTSVDKAEDEKEVCYNINVLGTKYVAEACKEINAKMVYISTDYVFDGEGDQPFDIDDKPNPINYYGKTKYEGELLVQQLVEKHFIVRVSWLFGEHGSNFVKTMIRLGNVRNCISVVGDQFGSPTYTSDLARFIVQVIDTDKYSIYHVTNEGFYSWYEFALQIFKSAGMEVSVSKVTTENYPSKARRPKNSKLSKSELDSKGFDRLPTVESSLKRLITQLRRTEE